MKMTGKDRLLGFVAAAWFVAGAAIATPWFVSLAGERNEPDALSVIIFILGPLLAAAAAAAVLAFRGNRKAAGACLIGSIVTPTGFAYPLNIVALPLGVWALMPERATAGTTSGREEQSVTT